jgi:hypothetical protein
MEYSDGTSCDLVNTPRSTTIEYVCGNTDSIISIIEDRTCHYKMIISSIHLCKHPSFVQRQPPSRAIKCEKVKFPLPSDPSADGDGLNSETVQVEVNEDGNAETL